MSVHEKKSLPGQKLLQSAIDSNRSSTNKFLRLGVYPVMDTHTHTQARESKKGPVAVRNASHGFLLFVSSESNGKCFPQPKFHHHLPCHPSPHSNHYWGWPQHTNTHLVPERDHLGKPVRDHLGKPVKCYVLLLYVGLKKFSGSIPVQYLRCRVEISGDSSAAIFSDVGRWSGGGKKRKPSTSDFSISPNGHLTH